MTAKVMMALGNYRYSIVRAAFDELVRIHNWKWEKQDRIGRSPAYQYMGLGEETITMQGRIYPYHRGGLGQIDAMRAEANQGKALILTDSLGKIWGKYCITSIQEKRLHFDAHGLPRRQDFSINLTAYGEDA